MTNYTNSIKPGTFISKVKVDIGPGERKRKLESICSEFLSIAGSYGFSMDEIVSEIEKRQGGRHG